MTAKEYLNQARGMQLRVEALEERIARLRSRAERMTARYGAAPGGSGRNAGLEAGVAKIVDLERELTRRVAAYAELIAGIERAIDAVPDPRQRDLLKFRYLNGWSWRKIAREMHLSEDRVWHLHGEALKVVRPPEGQTEAAAPGDGRNV